MVRCMRCGVRFSVTASAGSWDNYRGEVDGSGPLNEAGTLRVRGVVAYQDSNTFKKAYEHQRQLPATSC